jgi:hypothetical protein
MFAALDSDGSGELDKAEFDTFFASHLAPLDVKEEVSLLFEMVDKFEDDGSGAWVTPEQHNNSTTTACWASCWPPAAAAAASSGAALVLLLR